MTINNSQKKQMKVLKRCQEWQKLDSEEWKWWEYSINLAPWGNEFYRERILYCLSHYPENDSGIEFWRDKCLSWRKTYANEVKTNE